MSTQHYEEGNRVVSQKYFFGVNIDIEFLQNFDGEELP